MHAHSLQGRRCNLACQRSGTRKCVLQHCFYSQQKRCLQHCLPQAACRCQNTPQASNAGKAQQLPAHGIGAAAAAALLLLAPPVPAGAAWAHEEDAQHVVASHHAVDVVTAADGAVAAAPATASDSLPAVLNPAASSGAAKGGAAQDKKGAWTWGKPPWLTAPSLHADINLPAAIKLPDGLFGVKMPEIKLPEVKLPAVKLPSVNAPSYPAQTSMPSSPMVPSTAQTADGVMQAQESSQPGDTISADLKQAQEPPATSIEAANSVPAEAAAASSSSAAASAATAGIARNSALDVLLSEEEAAQLPQLPTSFPELRPLQLPNMLKAVLSNGIKVFLMEDHEVPLVRGTLIMRGGQYASPPDKVGLASLTMNVQRAGGSTQHPDGVLDEALEGLAASIDMGAGAQAFTLDFSCSSEDVAPVVGLWAEVLRSPTMPQSKLDFFKAQLNNMLDHQNDNPQAVARRELQKLMYGRDSIYARQPTKSGVAAIHRQDLLDFAQTWERPEGAVVGVVGDFQAPKMLSVLESALGSWTGPGGELPAVSRDPDPLAPAAQAAGNVYLVDRQGLSQASVAVGEPGVTLLDPDTYALEVLSSIFNSFGGQLFDQIRTREGLAYSVYGGWDSPPDHPGIFVGGGETSAPVEFLAGLRRVLGEATTDAPKLARLQAAKDEVLNAFVFNFASKANQLQRTLVYNILGLPEDLLFRYKAGVEAVGVDDVLRAAKAHLHPDQQVTVVVGDASAVAPVMKAAGFSVIPLELQKP